jgi:DNA-binding HxlR family transcriptional regulator
LTQDVTKSILGYIKVTSKGLAMTLHKPAADFAPQCPIRDVLDRLGDRWTLLVLMELRGGTLRFTALKKLIVDISPRMLAQTLRQLEYDGMVQRTVFPTIPPKVEYTLTPLGLSMLKPVGALIEWAGENHDAVRAARAAYVQPEPQVAL